ncbi:hypothetical protein RJ640_010517 [Escallonia rubra]|uniref:Pre-mRNA-processing factor 19 n=1 Tax=Escallonia rubra TaxID=112253 RepID=A0AA88UAH3_9ASTE|nr:hypothetical protein RJ640_010517 [Escallonia rubra]
MNCSISGEVPEEPVVSKKSGLLFEKRLIERHISDFGKCPVTGEPLSMDDVVPIKTGKIVKPRPVQAASIPGMLGMFQIEWDGLMLSNFALEQQLHTARQELSHALYQHDAACRVIARLKKERDEARSLLAQAERQIPMSASTAMAVNASPLSNGKRGSCFSASWLFILIAFSLCYLRLCFVILITAAENEEMGPDGKKIRPGIVGSIIEELADCNAALSQQRKKRQIPPTLAPIDAVERYTQLSSHPLHNTKSGILSVDIHYPKDLIATGGVDTNAVVFDRPSGATLSILSGHSKKVNSVKFVAEGEILVTGSADKTVRVWQASEDGNYNCRNILKDHTAEVQAVTIHATNNYFVTASLDNTWCFYELSSGLCLTQVTDTSEAEEGYTSAAFHPDGLILGTGTSGSIVKIWDVKSQANVARFDGHAGAVTAISFSENGYFLATAAQDGVKLWDLRKLRNFRTFTPYDENTPTRSVEFDHSGSYLALGGSDIRVYQVANVKSEWNCIKTFPDLSGKDKVTSVKFGPDAKYIAVGAMDHNLRIFGLPGEDGPMES